MFTKQSTSAGPIDSVTAMEGDFKFVDDEPHLRVTMMYSNKDTGSSFGSCTAQGNLLSPETMEAFRHFLHLAEKDFGAAALGEGATVLSPNGSFGAESSTGLKGLGGL